MTIAFPVTPARKVDLAHPKVTLVVPCYNEAERLRVDHFLHFADTMPEIDILFVNDGSTDDTFDVLCGLCQARPNQMSLLDMADNGGKAEAVRAGLLFAIEQGAELVGYWDADLATPLELVEDFVRVAQRHNGLDVIFGSRRQMVGHKIYRKFHRRIISRVCAALARIAIGQPVSDTQCGAKLLRATPDLVAALAKPFSAGWLFDVELLGRLASAKGPHAAPRLYELPLSEWTEIAGSKVTTSGILKSAMTMVQLIFSLRIRPTPLGDADLQPIQPAAQLAA